MRKQRFGLQSLQKRRVLFATLQGFGISLDDLAAKSGLTRVLFPGALGEYPARSDQPNLTNC